MAIDDVSSQRTASTTVSKSDERLQPIEDWEYLIHHIEVDDKGKEVIHHCLLYDHIANMFEQGHLVIKNGKPFLNGSRLKDGTYHLLTGIEQSQEVSWSDEDAQDQGIKPKAMMPGMTAKQKAREW